MSTESNNALVRRVIDEVWHGGNLAAIDVLFASDYVNHDPDTPDVRDRSAFKPYVQGLRAAFSDLRVSIDDLIAENDRVAKRWTARGTHDGPLPGIAATGKSVTFGGITIYRIANGQIAECWWSRDMASLLAQLGVLPGPAEPQA